MNKETCFIVTFLLINSVSVIASNFTFTYDMISSCKEHISQHGYSYETFYSVSSNERRQLKTDVGVILEMHIAILAASNGHILLSSVPSPQFNDPVYEIVGGGGNKFTELRRNLRKNAKQSENTVGILSPINFTAFYIRISEDGDIEFGKEGDRLPILAYIDTNPITVNYFSFASWSGVEAKFLYDCPAFTKNGTQIKTTDSKKVEPRLSNSAKIRKTLLKKSSAVAPPGEIVTVNLAITATHFQYNAFTAKLTTSFAVIASWTNEAMAWDPNEYNGTANIVFRQGEIWRPKLVVFNSDEMKPLDSESNEPITMANSGEATFHFRTKTNSWCLPAESSFSRWPRDEYHCLIVIGPWEAHEKLIIKEISTGDEKLKLFTGLDEVVPSEWEVVGGASIVNHTEWSDLINVEYSDTYQSYRYLYYIHLRRHAASYDIVFYTPLLVLMAFVLISFWSEPLQMSRLWFYAGTTVVMCSGLCYVDFLVPCHTTPYILVIYTIVLFCVLQSLIIQVLLTTRPVKNICQCHCIQHLLTSRIFRAIFCLTPIKNFPNYESINEAYSQDGDDAGVVVEPRNGNIEEVETDSTKYGDIVEVAEVIDKILFVVYSAIFIAMLCV